MHVLEVLEGILANCVFDKSDQRGSKRLAEILKAFESGPACRQPSDLLLTYVTDVRMLTDGRD